MPESNQPELPFCGGDDSSSDQAGRGLERWHAEQRAYVHDLSLRFGVALGAEVRVQLRDLDTPLTGRLEWVVGTEKPPRFRIRGQVFEFTLDEIESVVRSR